MTDSFPGHDQERFASFAAYQRSRRNRLDQIRLHSNRTQTIQKFARRQTPQPPSTSQTTGAESSERSTEILSSSTATAAAPSIRRDGAEEAAADVGLAEGEGLGRLDWRQCRRGPAAAKKVSDLQSKQTYVRKNMFLLLFVSFLKLFLFSLFSEYEVSTQQLHCFNIISLSVLFLHHKVHIRESLERRLL